MDHSIEETFMERSESEERYSESERSLNLSYSHSDDKLDSNSTHTLVWLLELLISSEPSLFYSTLHIKHSKFSDKPCMDYICPPEQAVHMM